MTDQLGAMTASSASLDDRLSRVEHDLMQIARRLYALEAFTDELNRVTREKPFRIWDDIVWMMLLDSRDMLVIHLASWAKSLIAAGGLLAEVKANHLADLPFARRATDRTDNDSHLRSLLDGYHLEAVGRLFPRASGQSATAADVDGLTQRVRQASDALRNDRNQNRAHAFERGKPGSAKMLDFSDLRTSVRAYEQLLNDIRLVGCASTLAYHDMNDADCRSAAEELVDAVLIGHSSRQELVMAGRDRNAYYAWLHEKLEKHAGATAKLFNEFWD